MKISRKKLKQIIKEEIINEMYGIKYDRRLINQTIVNINHKFRNKIGDKVWNTINKIAKDIEDVFTPDEISISIYGKRIDTLPNREIKMIHEVLEAFEKADIIKKSGIYAVAAPYRRHYIEFSLTEKGFEPSPEDMVDKELSFIGIKDY